MRSLKFPFLLSLPMRIYAGFRRPTRVKIIGRELAGEIEAVGKDVRSFKAGDMPEYGEYSRIRRHIKESLSTNKPASGWFLFLKTQNRRIRYRDCNSV